ncbi:MAG TPA: zf-HC2 domain-containing protein [Candidatus Deferrimicrobium sp.]
MDCIRARNLLSEYQDGTLDAAVAAALAAHLRGCGECSGRVGSLVAVREHLRGLPPDPAPPELLARVLAAVEAEDLCARSGSAPGGAEATRPFLSRLRIPLEAAAVVLLFASVYWYQRIPTPVVHPPSGVTSEMPSEAGKVSSSRPMAAKKEPSKSPPSGIRLPRGNPKTAMKEVAPAAASLPSVPVLRASTDSERIVPVVPSPRPTADPAAAGAPAFGESQMPYGRDIAVDVKPENREGAEERIAEATLLLGGIVERIERESESTRKGATGTVRVILPEDAAAGFLDELRRIGTVPPERPPSAIDIPAGPRPGTVAYAVRIRVR